MFSIVWLLCKSPKEIAESLILFIFIDGFDFNYTSGFLVITASAGDFRTSLGTIRFQQKIKEMVESLLRFSFIHSLIICPCDFSSNMFYSEDAPWRDLTGNGRILLFQQELAGPFQPRGRVRKNLNSA
jgi:hypothetical protein